jgi:hypothetical protein
VDKIRILYFLEDRAQEGFITALVERIAKEESISSKRLTHEIRSGRGGSMVINEFRKFLKDYSEVGTTDADFLVVAIDGNCMGHNERLDQLDSNIEPGHKFKDKVVYAIPNPHIERWYIMDQRALKEGVGLKKAPDLPTYKCEKGYYKQVLSKALKDSNVTSLLGGAEYAEKIVENIENLDSLGKQDSSFQTFVADLRRMFKRS